MAGRDRSGPVRYAVVGLGHIAQVAVLPAFAHAAENSEVTALISDDPEKRQKLGRRYKVSELFDYGEYDDALRSGTFDAVYIALPNHLHREYAERAAEAGIHVLCEKPLAVTERDCEAMIYAAERNDVRLMTAYRLHFEEANLRAVELVQSGRLGEPRLFNSTFTLQVKDDDIRFNPRSEGGGVLYDIGIYCINAARYLFQDEPLSAFAVTASGDDPRFKAVEESVAAVLTFPGDRLATFAASFGAADVSSYRVVGSKGDLRMDPAYEYAGEITQTVTVNGRSRDRKFPRRDQFAPELVSFSECVLTGTEPEPSGREGLADVRVIRALYRSAETGRPVELAPFEKSVRPTPDQAIRKPGVRKPPLVNVESPSE
jgi:glucose-fructose oxidoreductase